MSTIYLSPIDTVEVDTDDALDAVIEEIGADEVFSRIKANLTIPQPDQHSLTRCCELAVEVLREAGFKVYLQKE